MFSVDYFLFLSLLAWSDWWLLVYSVCCLYMWGMGRWVTSFACWSLLVNRPGRFWARWSVLSRGERVAECKEKNLVRRDAFSGYNGYRPKFGRMAISVFVQWLMFRGCRVVMPNGHPFFVQCLAFNECPPIKSGRMVISLIVQCWCRVSLFLLFCGAVR